MQKFSEIWNPKVFISIPLGAYLKKICVYLVVLVRDFSYLFAPVGYAFCPLFVNPRGGLGGAIYSGFIFCYNTNMQSYFKIWLYFGYIKFIKNEVKPC